MLRRKPTTLRVLAIAPSSKGFGYAVIEEPFRLVDWGVKSVSKDKNRQSIAKVKELMAHYSPRLLALPEIADADCRRSSRIQELVRELVGLAEQNGLEVQDVAQKEIQNYFDGRGGTKHDVARFLAEAFPDELGAQLPPKRRPWMSEDYRMDIFAAVALAIVCQWKQNGKR